LARYLKLETQHVVEKDFFDGREMLLTVLFQLNGN
jgi:hypothetical protein